MYWLAWISFITTVYNTQKRRQNQYFRILVIFQHFYTIHFIFKDRTQPLTIVFFFSVEVIYYYTYYMKKIRLLRVVLYISYIFKRKEK